MEAFHVMTKPIGPICNLGCTYCFYLEKEKLFPADKDFRMSEEVLESYVSQYISSQNGQEVSFAWQGGEPTLLGVPFFEKALALQAKYAGGKKIQNALQTNGILLDDRWCEFLKKHEFLVGLSIDGPRGMHDAYRVDKGGKPTFEKVLRGLRLLTKHRVDFNTLTVVNRINAKHPLEVYQFLKEIGSGFIQFIPLVERTADAGAAQLGLDLALPPDLPVQGTRSPVTEWSVQPNEYGEFLVQIFDHWVRHDIGKYFVQLFDVALGNWAGLGSGLCVFAEKCGSALALEHNGDLFSCDHYVYPRYHLGNILNQSLRAMADSPTQRRFGDGKLVNLPRYCLDCPVRFACNGECPKHRFARTPNGDPGLNYLCPAYKRFFSHIDPCMRTMTRLLQCGRAPAEIMALLKQQPIPGNHPRNNACPCGSGKKYKHCCHKQSLSSPQR